MNKLEKILLIIPIFFGGGFLFLVLGAISEVLPDFYRWADSLPLWGVWIIYMVFGTTAYIVYDSHTKKDDKDS